MSSIEVRPELTIVWPKGWASWDISPPKSTSEQFLIYVSAPYSLGDVVSNVRYACEIGDKILAKGHIPFVPHLSHFWHFISPKSYEEWLRIDSAIVPRCDALLRVDGKSPGADIEVDIALQHEIPVYYSLDDIPKYIP